MHKKIQGLFITAALGAALCSAQTQPATPDATEALKNMNSRIHLIGNNLPYRQQKAYLNGEFKMVLAQAMPKGVTAMVDNDTIILPIMATPQAQAQLASSLFDYMAQQKKDGLPYQPACFSGGYRTDGGMNYTRDLGLQPIPVGC